ncbi:MAG: ComEC family competence protein, partial [Alistipes sp.]|nr:ComEC family competence protein [Alistipes sp.]
MAPFVKLILPAGLGILFHHVTGLGWGYCAVCLAVSWVSGWWFAGRRAGGGAGPYPWLAVFFFFAGAGPALPPRAGQLPDREYIHAEVVVAEQAAGQGRWRRAAGTVTAYRRPGGDVWCGAGFGVQLYLDTAYRAAAGERLLVRGYFNAFGPAEGSYGALMIRRGIHGRMYVTGGSLLAVDQGRAGLFAGLHARAVGKMSRLPGDRDKTAVATAMVSGHRRTIPREVSAAYRDGGGAHLLAVSGLHVGIVFVLVNLLLGLLPLVRRGHVVKNVVAVGAIWLFAAAAGLSPSIVRAALMFSFMQLALARGAGRHGLNALAGSAFVTLAIDPRLAADPGFVLSYAAVLAILLYYGPLYSLVKSRSRIFNRLVGIYVVGTIACLAVSPVVAYC